MSISNFIVIYLSPNVMVPYFPQVHYADQVLIHCRGNGPIAKTAPSNPKDPV